MVVAVGASAHVEIRYMLDADGVNWYQMLRETFVWHEDGGGSPVAVAKVRSFVFVEYGKGPAAGMTSAFTQLSLAGGPETRSWIAVSPTAGASVPYLQTRM